MKINFKNLFFLFLIITISSTFLYGCASNPPKIVPPYCPKGYNIHDKIIAGMSHLICMKKSKINVCNVNKKIPGLYMIGYGYGNNMCSMVVSTQKCPHGYHYNSNALSRNDVCVANEIKCIYGYPTGRENIEKFPERCLDSNRNKVIKGVNYTCKQGPIAVSSNSNLWKVDCKAKTHPECPAGFSHYSLFGGGTCVKKFHPKKACPSGYKAYVSDDMNLDGRCVKITKTKCPKGSVKRGFQCIGK
jgi:hypothetical protein